MCTFAEFIHDQIIKYKKSDVIAIKYYLKGNKDCISVKFSRQSMMQASIAKYFMDFVETRKVSDPDEVNEFCKIRFTAWARLKVDGSDSQRNSIEARYGRDILEWVDLVDSGDEKANYELRICTQLFVAMKRARMLGELQEKSRKFRELSIVEHPAPELSDQKKQELIDKWHPEMVFDNTTLPSKVIAHTFFNYGIVFMGFGEISKGGKYRYQFDI